MISKKDALELLEGMHFEEKDLFYKFKKYFPDLLNWIISSPLLMRNIEKIKITYVSTNEIKDDGRITTECYLSIYTKTYLYGIHAEKPTNDSPRGELDGVLMLREKSSGQKDLRDGAYSEKTWKNILKQILEYEFNVHGKLLS
jgi:hypothetical protein